MINSYLRTYNGPISGRSSFSSAYTKTTQNNNKKNKYRLLIIILSRAIQQNLKFTFDTVHSHTVFNTKILRKMVSLADKNTNLAVYLSFDRLKNFAKTRKLQFEKIKTLATLIKRVEKYSLKSGMSELVNYLYLCSKNQIKVIRSQRGQTMNRKLFTLIRKQKKIGINKINGYSKHIKSYCKLRIICVITNKYIKALKQSFFSRATRMMISSGSNKATQKQMVSLKNQIGNLSMQLQTKEQNMSKMQSEMSQMKIENSNMSIRQNQSYGDYSSSNKITVKKYGQKRLNSMDRSFQSKDNPNDISIGSILGSLNKSRANSISRYGGEHGDCNCIFKGKYYKYKSTSQSLKNQLEIVKEELDVAKDLNDHFTNEIKQYLSGENSQVQYESLKKQLKFTQEEKDHLKKKVFKLQEHIQEMKKQFKIKMEDIYRKVKKDY